MDDNRTVFGVLRCQSLGNSHLRCGLVLVVCDDPRVPEDGPSVGGEGRETKQQRGCRLGGTLPIIIETAIIARSRADRNQITQGRGHAAGTSCPRLLTLLGYKPRCRGEDVRSSSFSWQPSVSVRYSPKICIGTSTKSILLRTLH